MGLTTIIEIIISASGTLLVPFVLRMLKNHKDNLNRINKLEKKVIALETKVDISHENIKEIKKDIHYIRKAVTKGGN